MTAKTCNVEIFVYVNVMHNVRTNLYIHISR